MPQDLIILNPEKTVITFRLAGLGARIGAHLLDIVIVIGCMFGLNALITAFAVFTGAPGFFFGLSRVLSIAFPFLYFILQEGLWNGQTIGKKSAGIRVRMADGSALTFQAAVVRNLLRTADMFPPPYLAGILSMFLTPNAQRIGDLAAGTVVLYEKKKLPYFTPAPYSRGEHSCEKYLPDLRKMTVEEYIALKKMCDRFPEFSANIQNQMLRDLWEPIRRKLEVPEVQNIHPIYMAEATVMKYGRSHGLM